MILKTINILLISFFYINIFILFFIYNFVGKWHSSNLRSRDTCQLVAAKSLSTSAITIGQHLIVPSCGLAGPKLNRHPRAQGSVQRSMKIIRRVTYNNIGLKSPYQSILIFVLYSKKIKSTRVTKVMMIKLFNYANFMRTILQHKSLYLCKSQEASRNLSYILKTYHKNIVTIKVFGTVALFVSGDIFLN